MSVNRKHVQLVKIYMPCNFEVNLITRLGVIALFSSFFSSPDPKGHVRYCHHLASVVRPLTFSYFNLLLVPFGLQTWPPRLILFSDWLMLKKSSPLKLLGQMEPNLAGSIYVRSSIKLLHLIPFSQQTWPLLLKIEHRVK